MTVLSHMLFDGTVHYLDGVVTYVDEGASEKQYNVVLDVLYRNSTQPYLVEHVKHFLSEA